MRAQNEETMAVSQELAEKLIDDTLARGAVEAPLAEHEEMDRWKRLPVWAQQELEFWRVDEAHQRGRAELAISMLRLLQMGPSHHLSASANRRIQKVLAKVG